MKLNDLAKPKADDTINIPLIGKKSLSVTILKLERIENFA